MSTATLDKDTAIEQVKELTISSVSSRALATELLASLKGFKKSEEASKEEKCRPLKTAWDNAKKPFDDFIKKCDIHIDALQKKMSAYDIEQDRLARIEQAKSQAKIDAENAKKIAKAEQKGKDVSEVVLKVAPVVQTAPKTVTTQDGSTQTRSARTIYSIKGAVEDEDLTAVDPRIAALIKSYPALFRMDWVAFRKLASTGMLDQCVNVESRTEYSYDKRGGK